MINKEIIERICDMARLEINESDKEKFVGQMNDILGYVEQVAKLDTSSVGGRESVFDEKNVINEDEIASGLTPSQLRKYTKNYLDGYYAVPKILNKG